MFVAAFLFKFTFHALSRLLDFTFDEVSGGQSFHLFRRYFEPLVPFKQCRLTRNNLTIST